MARKRRITIGSSILLLTEQRNQQKKRNDLPHRGDRTSERKEFGNRHVPQVLSYNGDDDNGNDKGKDRGNYAFEGLALRTGHIRHAFHAGEAETL
jgi:hypothetical protein